MLHSFIIFIILTRARLSYTQCNYLANAAGMVIQESLPSQKERTNKIQSQNPRRDLGGSPSNHLKTANDQMGDYLFWTTCCLDRGWTKQKMLKRRFQRQASNSYMWLAKGDSAECGKYNRKQLENFLRWNRCQRQCSFVLTKSSSEE